SDRRTKEHDPPPNPYQREGSVDGWGKYGLKGQKQVSPRQRLGDCSQPTFAQNGQKNYYFTHPFAIL
ncbi:MAG: hypothetical protein J5942_04825, partial [Prevotella sp.]|nr:hypothetical protein [Prevotella sp.]